MVRYSLGLLAFALAVGIAYALLVERLPVGSLLKFLGAWFGISALIATVVWMLGRAERRGRQ